MKPLTQKKTVSIIKDMIEAIKEDDSEKKADISKKYPWTNKWLHKRCHLIDLKEISVGDNFKIKEERPVSDLREGYGLSPLLNVIISSSRGERTMRFEPILGGENMEKFQLI